MKKTTKFILTTIVIVMLSSCKKTETTGIEGDDNRDNNITIGNNNVVINDQNNVLIDSIDIPGKWNRTIASSIVLNLVNKQWDSISNSYSHKIVNFFNIDYGDKEAIICVAFSKYKPQNKNGTYEPYNCHSCHGELSFIEFIKYLNGWKIENEYIRCIEDGQWGEPSESWKLINIGFHKFAFVNDSGGTGQGYTEISTEIYSIVGDEFKMIFKEMTGEDDSGAKEIAETSYSSNIEIIKEGTSFYDIILTLKGIKNGKPLNEKKYYKFNGIKYIISNNIK